MYVWPFPLKVLSRHLSPLVAVPLHSPLWQVRSSAQTSPASVEPSSQSSYGSAFPSSGVGEGVGAEVGEGVGAAVGEGVGAAVGDGVGAGEGGAVGAGVGCAVGAAVGASVAAHSSQPVHGSMLHIRSAGTFAQNGRHGAGISIVEHASQPLHGGIPHFSSHSFGIFSQKSLHSAFPAFRCASITTCIACTQANEATVVTTCIAIGAMVQNGSRRVQWGAVSFPITTPAK